MQVRRAGPSAILIELPGTEAVSAAYELLTGLRERGDLTAADIVPAARTVLLDGVPDPDRVFRLLPRDLTPAAEPDGQNTTITITTRYDGEDLDDVARLWGTDRAGVIAIHTGTAFRVAFCGFAPGFAYLTGLGPRHHVPRRPTPRTRVPAGTVALAGPYSGVYPTASPGGWQLIGRTRAALFDLDRDPPALLTPGATVRFVEEA
ncbi:5-oxoprolinase subunit B family protein [Catenuloplanes atrovinosus]|uniref:KipI family sensor histidine kinase inhibitor n=1 Tax=Catenuloplanes atrovinosus TaxID=137266 RepID=A0AAE3YR56_9ACTN|nr:allophanate hydrolase subunit 1 [Catenuloplanes atrovinosus]MDR7278468.1 KipI family sensor histidine kinase inhibitor [Catenuloplanes atrovinosus]